MFSLSALFQQCGWVPSLALILVIAVFSTQSSLYLAQTMQGFRSNATFSKRLEFGNTMFYLLPRWGYYLSMATLCIVFFSQNLANIILTAQVMDYTVLDALGSTCGLDYVRFAWTCIHKGDAGHAAAFKDSVFGDEYVLSYGYLIILVVCIPLGMINLDDNIGFQIAGCVVTVGCVGVWVANFVALGLHGENMPAMPPNNTALPTLLSTVLFNYGFVATIPSWLNEKRPSVSVASTVAWGNFAATTQFLVVSIPAALALGNLPGANLLAVMGRGSLGGQTFWKASQIMVYLFPIANILTSIPIFSIIIRYNILQIHGIKVPVSVSNLFAVVLPWVVALPLCVGNSLATVINWSSALLFTLMNFILPLAAYLQFAANEAEGKERIDLEAEEAAAAAAAAAAADIAAASSSKRGGGNGKKGGKKQDEGSFSSRATSFLTNPKDRLLREASLSLLGSVEEAVADGGGAEKGYTGLYPSLNSGSGSNSGAMVSSLNSSGGYGRVGEEEYPEDADTSIVSPMCVRSREGPDGKPLRIIERWYARVIFYVSLLIAALTIGLQAYITTLPPPADDDDSSTNTTSAILNWVDLVYGGITPFKINT